MSLAADGLPPLREVVAAHGLAAKKSLGQNFLFDLNLTGRIARASGPLEGVAVVEIGPGPGGLTRALLAHGAQKVIAIERDDRCLAALAEIAAHWPGRLQAIAGDALTIAPEALVAAAEGAPIRICANLPYNIATILLTRWLEAEPWPPFYERLTLMFQREVALRIVATPAERADYGRLAVLAGWRARARLLFDVPPAAFTPPPKVTSSVVELIPRGGVKAAGGTSNRIRACVAPAGQHGEPAVVARCVRRRDDALRDLALEHQRQPVEPGGQGSVSSQRDQQRRRDVIRQVGADPDRPVRAGGERRRSTSSASPATTSSRPGHGAAISASAGRQRASRSIAMTFRAPSASSARVRPPGPGPTSTTVTPSSGPARAGDPAGEVEVEQEILAERPFARRARARRRPRAAAAARRRRGSRRQARRELAAPRSGSPGWRARGRRCRTPCRDRARCARTAGRASR